VSGWGVGEARGGGSVPGGWGTTINGHRPFANRWVAKKGLVGERKQVLQPKPNVTLEEPGGGTRVVGHADVEQKYQGVRHRRKKKVGLWCVLKGRPQGGDCPPRIGRIETGIPKMGGRETGKGGPIRGESHVKWDGRKYAPGSRVRRKKGAGCATVLDS